MYYVHSLHAFLDVPGVPSGAVGLRIGCNGPNRRGFVSAVEGSHQIKPDARYLIPARVDVLLRRYIVLHGLLDWPYVDHPRTTLVVISYSALPQCRIIKGNAVVCNSSVVGNVSL